MKQESLPLFPAGRGGKRKGAGRPRGTRTSHHRRPGFVRPTPVHVTVRVRRHVWNLRSGRCYRRIAACLEKAAGSHGLRVIEYAVLGNHVHFIAEADSAHALARGMQGLGIRIAKALNRLMKGSGSVFADHYDGHILRSPTELVRAIAYVLRNHEHHFGEAGRDAFSSEALPPGRRRALLAAPLSWLLREGWRRAPAPDLRRLEGLKLSVGPDGGSPTSSTLGG